MIILLPLLRKLSVRTRVLVGSVLTGAGLVVIVIALVVAPGILIHGAVAAVVGLVFLASAWSSRRRIAARAGVVTRRVAAR